MTDTFDLTDILFAQRSKPRGDEEKAHVADLYGCDRATWFRRNGMKPTPFTREKLAQFAMGLAYEAEVAKRLRESGATVETDFEVRIAGLTGHPDIWVASDDRKSDVLIEVKTTEARKPKDEVSPHHAVQAAAYALATRSTRAIVLVKHAGSHVETTYEVNPKAYEGLIYKRAAEVLEATAPGAPVPPAEPSDLAPWLCSYCDYRMCERNPNYEGDPAW